MRDSSTGGPQYTHLRGNSLASTAGVGSRGSMDGLDGTETTLAETLWEDQSDRPTSYDPNRFGGEGGNGGGASSNAAPGSPSNPRRALPRRNSRAKGPPPPLPHLMSRNSSNAIPKVQPQVPPSPAYAVGTGMARSASGIQYAGGGPNAAAPTNQDATGATSQAEQTAEQERSAGVNPFAQILGRISIDESRQ